MSNNFTEQYMDLITKELKYCDDLKSINSKANNMLISSGTEPFNERELCIIASISASEQMIRRREIKTNIQDTLKFIKQLDILDKEVEE